VASTDEPSGTDAVLRISTAAAAGDKSAFRELFDRYYGRVYRYVLVVASGDTNAAQEAAQEVFLRLHRHLQPFQSDERIWLWLTRAARSVLVDAHRTRLRQFKLKYAFEENAVTRAEPEEVVLQELESCVNELTFEERQVVEHFYFGRESVQQISAAMGTTYKAVESRLSRIRAKLRQRLLEKLSHE
jgi:RNA polymerase sigma-70 factor, ECF subfamily